MLLGGIGLAGETKDQRNRQVSERDAQHDIDFIVKDSTRFPDGHAWGYGEFELDAATNTFRIGNMQDHPPQANDAKCGVACHMAAQDRDYVFTKYAAR